MKESDEENIINEKNNINNINNSEEKKELIPDDDNQSVLDYDNSKVPQENSKLPNIYKLKIITKQENEAFIFIQNEKSELSFKCYCYIDYFKKIFKNSFSLDKLKEQSKYFHQFSEINRFLMKFTIIQKKVQNL